MTDDTLYEKPTPVIDSMSVMTAEPSVVVPADDVASVVLVVVPGMAGFGGTGSVYVAEPNELMLVVPAAT